MARTDQATLLCAPECEAHATTILSRLLCQSQRCFEHSGRAAAVVIDPGPLGHAIKVRTDDDQCALVVEASVGHDVSSRALACDSVDREAHGVAGPGRKRAAIFVRHTDHGNGSAIAQNTRERVGATIGAFIHDDDADGTGRNGVVDLDLELACPTSHQRYSAALEAVEIFAFASAD